MAFDFLAPFRAFGRASSEGGASPAQEFKQQVARDIPRQDADTTFHGSFALNEAGLLNREVTDLDILCTSHEAAWKAMKSDVARLEEKGYTVHVKKKHEGEDDEHALLNATVSKGAHKVDIDWSCVRDHAFPPVAHKDYGFVADPRDVAAGKMQLILRNAFADNKHFGDLIHMHEQGVSLNGAVAQAGLNLAGLSDTNDMLEVFREHQRLSGLGADMPRHDALKPQLYAKLGKIVSPNAATVPGKCGPGAKHGTCVPV